MQLKTAIEAQSLEIAKLQAKINSTVGTAGYVRIRTKSPPPKKTMLVDRTKNSESECVFNTGHYKFQDHGGRAVGRLARCQLHKVRGASKCGFHLV
jgi:hypothetical protein